MHLRTRAPREYVPSRWKGKLPFIRCSLLPLPCFQLLTTLDLWPELLDLVGFPLVSSPPLRTNSSCTSFQNQDPWWHSSVIGFLQLESNPASQLGLVNLHGFLLTCCYNSLFFGTRVLATLLCLLFLNASCSHPLSGSGSSLPLSLAADPILSLPYPTEGPYPSSVTFLRTVSSQSPFRPLQWEVL